MNLDMPHFLALMPLIALTATAVLVMLCAAFCRHHLLIVSLTIGGLLLSMASLHYQNGQPPQTVTALLAFDDYSIFFMALIMGATAIIAALCYSYFEGREGLHEELYILLLTSALGAVVLVASTHFASFFLGLEILSVSLFALVAYPVTSLTRRDALAGAPLEAGIKYLVLSGLSSAILGLGMAFVYAATGEMAFARISAVLVDMAPNLYAVAGIALMVAGIAFKLSLVPFHMWTPDVYQGAPAPVTAFLSAISKSAVLALILRGFMALDGQQHAGVLLAISAIAMASMLIGNLLALLQDNVKRLLAYSSISHSGYILVAFMAALSAGDAGQTLAYRISLEAVAYYIVTYVLTSLTAFGVLSVLSSSAQRKQQIRDMDGFDEYRGLFWQRPVMASVLALALLSSAGIPLTIGFIGKFYLFVAGVKSALWLALLVLVISTGISLFYYLRLILILFKSEPDSHAGATADSIGISGDSALPLGSRWLLAGLGGLILWLGVYPAPLVRWVQQILLQLA